jgi:hypothetical protein
VCPGCKDKDIGEQFRRFWSGGHSDRDDGQRRLLSVVFNSYDANGDNMLSQDEFFDALEAHGKTFESEQDKMNFYSYVDLDKNDVIDVTVSSQINAPFFLFCFFLLVTVSLCNLFPCYHRILFFACSAHARHRSPTTTPVANAFVFYTQ